MILNYLTSSLAKLSKIKQVTKLFTNNFRLSLMFQKNVIVYTNKTLI
jgi:hypothetical protein